MVVIALLTYMLTLSAVVDGVEILTPTPNTSVWIDQTYLVGRTGAPLVEVFVNGDRLGDARVIDSVFHARIKYGYGLNEIVVRSVLEDTSQTVSEVHFELLYVPPGGIPPKHLFPTHQFHASPAGEDCRACHTLPDQMTDTLDSAPCMNCHVEFTDSRSGLRSRHESCLTCHPVPSLVRTARRVGDRSADRCFGCHPDKIEQFSQEYVHGPVAGGGCIVCHDPHLSEFEHSLVDAEENLCFSCHEFGQELREYPVQHPPFASGRCSTCHDPHSTSNRWVLTRSSEEVCLPCHESDGRTLTDHGHPYNVKPKKHAAQNVKLSRKGRLECISCHDPHASRSAHLLRTSQRNACLGCHGEKL